MYGTLTNVAIAFQDSYGVDSYNVDSLHFVPFLNEDVGLEKPPLVAQTMRGIFEEGNHYEGANAVSGNLAIEAQAIPLGVLLKSVLEHTNATLTDSVYEHTFRPRTGDFDTTYCAGIPITYYKAFESGSADLFYDLNGSSLEISISDGELLQASVGFVGGQHTERASLSTSYPVGEHFAWSVSSLSLGGGAIDDIKSLTVSVEENLEPHHTLKNSKFPSRVKRSAMRAVAATGDILFDNRDEYEEFLNQTERQLFVNFRNTTEISSGHYEEVTIDIPKFRYFSFKPTAGEAGEIQVSFEAKGIYDTSSSYSIEVTLVNTQSDY